MQRGADLIRAAGLVQKLKEEGTTVTPPDIYTAFITLLPIFTLYVTKLCTELNSIN